jgi:lysophospholipase L1-like esterase
MQRTLSRLKSGRSAVVVALGDSNTEVTFHTRGQMNWFGLLEAGVFMRYGAGLCRFINASKCGGTMADGLARLDHDVLRFAPDLVILSLGLNDAGRGLEALPAFRQSTRSLIARIRSEVDAEVLVRTFNPVVSCNGFAMPAGVAAGGVIDRGSDAAYAAALVEIAGESGLPCVDHFALWSKADFVTRAPVANPNRLWLRMSDAVHPGPLGHLAFYRELAPLFGLDPYLPWEAMGDQVQA